MCLSIISSYWTTFDIVKEFNSNYHFLWFLDWNFTLDCSWLVMKFSPWLFTYLDFTKENRQSKVFLFHKSCNVNLRIIFSYFYYSRSFKIPQYFLYSVIWIICFYKFILYFYRFSTLTHALITCPNACPTAGMQYGNRHIGTGPPPSRRLSDPVLHGHQRMLIYQTDTCS